MKGVWWFDHEFFFELFMHLLMGMCLKMNIVFLPRWFNLHIYVLAFVATKNGVSMTLIGLCHINANPIWIYVHNLTLLLGGALVKI